MNYNKFTKQISKINNFFESISEDEEISEIERDLLLSYIRKLYESALKLDESDKSNKQEKHSKNEIKFSKTTTYEPPVMPKVEQVVEQQVVTQSPVQHVDRQPFERVAVEAPVKVEATTSQVDPHVAYHQEPAPTAIEVAEPVKSKSYSAEMEEIFEVRIGGELSDKLSNLPIKDLTKAMSINEKIFTIQELFNGNQQKFNDTLSEVNRCSSYEEAKDHLMSGVASEFQWDQNSRSKKAENFVKLVQRRFR